MDVDEEVNDEDRKMENGVNNACVYRKTVIWSVIVFCDFPYTVWLKTRISW